MHKNSSGTIYYGMHFYPGLAAYDQPNQDSYKIFLNEDTLRKMDPTFAGKPIFVEHVDEVDQNLDSLRKDADGWVVESFFNSADGKHWVKFIVVSEKGERAIRNGFKLSNAYIPKLNGKSGLWNAIPYQDEVIDGEYEHLAIVKNPRYDESVIMSPEDFKTYNENLKVELNRISNSTPKEKDTMIQKLKFWERKAVQNSTDLENLCVTLPKTGKEYSLFTIINAMDEMEEKKKENMADYGMKVKLHDGKKCNVGELLDKYKNMHEEMEGMKKMNREEETETDLEPKKVPLDVEGDLHNEDEMEEAEEEEKKKELKNKKMNKEDEEKEDGEEEDGEEKEEKMKNKKMKNAIALKKKENFESLKNAHLNAPKLENRYDSMEDKLSRGKSMYGSK